MIKKVRETGEIISEICNYIPYFNENEFIKYSKWSIKKLWESLQENDINKTKVKHSKKIEEKMLKEKEKYRLVRDIDHISVQYARICDCDKKGNTIYVKAYLSIYFYDNVKNNSMSMEEEDKYWNDTWIVTYKKDENTQTNNCINCGAPMEYNKKKDIYECKYCETRSYNRLDIDWQIFDIEIEN